MSLVGFKARNHRQQVLVRGANPAVDERATTPKVFDPLNERFRFTVDVCATERTTKVPHHFFTPVEDGLEQPWAGERVWCNPPYSAVAPWVEKAWHETNAEVVVMLLPANRTEQGWWQEMVEPFRDREGSPLRAEFMPGRLRLIAHTKDRVEPNERPPFGCVLLIWDRACGAANGHPGSET